MALRCFLTALARIPDRRKTMQRNHGQLPDQIFIRQSKDCPPARSIPYPNLSWPKSSERRWFRWKAHRAL